MCLFSVSENVYFEMISKLAEKLLLFREFVV